MKTILIVLSLLAYILISFFMAYQNRGILPKDDFRCKDNVALARYVADTADTAEWYMPRFVVCEK